MRQIKWLVIGVFIGLPMLSACANRTPAVTHERLPEVTDTTTHPLPPVTEQPKQAVAAPVEKHRCFQRPKSPFQCRAQFHYQNPFRHRIPVHYRIPVHLEPQSGA